MIIKMSRIFHRMLRKDLPFGAKSFFQTDNFHLCPALCGSFA